MPKGLLLFLLILLIGGYFFLAPKGATTEEKLPSIELKAVVNTGENGYIVGVDGTLTLPLEKEYNVQGEVYLSVGGVKVKTTKISSTVRGPSTVPLSLAGSEVTSENVAVGVDLSITVDGRTMPVKMETPVTFPPKSTSLQLPALGVSVASFDVVEGGYDVTLKLTFYNPNPFDVELTNVSLKVGDNSYPVTVGTIQSKDRVSVEVPLTVEGNAVAGEVKGKVRWGSVTKDFDYKFELAFPSITPPIPEYSLKTNVTSISSSGVTLDVNVTVKNPSTIPVTITNLSVKVVKGNITQTKSLADSVTLGPLEEKTFSATVTSVPFLVGGEVQLESNGKVVLTAPLELVPSSLVKPPELNVWVEDLNGGGNIIHVKLTNPNDFNIDIQNFDIEALYSGNDLASYASTSFSLDNSKEVTVGSVSSPLALVPDQTWIRVTYTYGIKDLGLTFNGEFVTLYTG